jgi:uncharacterized protein (TIGR03067 family)
MNVLNLFKSCLLASLFVAGIVGCSKQTTENATLEGRWSGYENGQTEKITIEFTGNRFAHWDAQNNELGSGTFVVNDTVQPKQMDLTFEKITAPQYVGKVALAIYELNGDELKFAGSEPGSTQRPPDISGGPGVRTFTLRRE